MVGWRSHRLPICPRWSGSRPATGRGSSWSVSDRGFPGVRETAVPARPCLPGTEQERRPLRRGRPLGHSGPPRRGPRRPKPGPAPLPVEVGARPGALVWGLGRVSAGAYQTPWLRSTRPVRSAPCPSPYGRVRQAGPAGDSVPRTVQSALPATARFL